MNAMKRNFCATQPGAEPDLAAVAMLLGEPARAAMSLALMDGRALPAGELALRARISPQTASNHLAKLVRARVLLVERQGRWRYYRLGGEAVARAVEALAAIAPPLTTPRDAGNEATRRLRDARTCYKHLAGKLGVGLADALIRERWVEEDGRNYAITTEGIARLAEMGIDVARLRSGRDPIARKCLDWSERRYHVAGPLGAAILEVALRRDWIRRPAGTRAVLLTPVGRAGLRRLLGRCVFGAVV